MGVDYPGRVKYAVWFAFAAAGALASFGENAQNWTGDFRGYHPLF